MSEIKELETSKETTPLTPEEIKLSHDKVETTEFQERGTEEKPENSLQPQAEKNADIEDTAFQPRTAEVESESVKETDLPEKEPEKEEHRYSVEDLASLEHTENFSDTAIEHIFEGQINGRGKAVGYHYEGVEETKGAIIEGSKDDPDENGVYRAKVTVDGVQKTANDGYSSFFPEAMEAQDVVDTINEAYENREHDRGNGYIGESKSGIEVYMFLDKDDKILSAFPIYEGDEDR